MRAPYRSGLLCSALVFLVGAVAVTTQTTPPAAQARPPVDSDAMRAHYGVAIDLHAAVIRGDLPAANAAAAWIAANGGPAPQPPASARQVDVIRKAAERAASARDIVAAASATASLLSLCGPCHRASGTRPALSLPRPPVVGGVVGHMLEHQRAVEQMLQGLVVPSDALWREGAKSFAASPLHPAELPVNSSARRQMMSTEERLHKAAAQAVEATDSVARVSAYGLILSACADCHRQHPKIWGPRPR
jgi:hypothetical protein